jgi:hypothetical protein
MSKSGAIMCRIVHIICGLDACVLHEVWVGGDNIKQSQENGLLWTISLVSGQL